METVDIRREHPQKAQPSKNFVPTLGGKLKGQSKSTETLALFELDSQLHHVPQDPTWTALEPVVGSGAAESMAPVDALPWVPVV